MVAKWILKFVIEGKVFWQIEHLKVNFVATFLTTFFVLATLAIFEWIFGYDQFGSWIQTASLLKKIVKK